MFIQGSFADRIISQIKDPIGSDGLAVVVWRAATPSAAEPSGQPGTVPAQCRLPLSSTCRRQSVTARTTRQSQLQQGRQ
jgi:hypothetical protein